ncbi:MAG: hypothetical protein MJ236_03810, partial [Clostridia bacterium]|nr:hypothetical protein [Clostridia bacterium]
MKNIRKILCLLLTLAMIIPIISSCGKNNTAEDVKTNYDIEGEFVTKAGTNKFVKVNENSKYVLYVNYYNGQARVEDKQSGITYYTNPENANNDSLASGFNKNALLSVITVVYTTQK